MAWNFVLKVSVDGTLSKSGQMAALPAKVAAFSATRKYTSLYIISVYVTMAGVRRPLLAYF